MGGGVTGAGQAMSHGADLVLRGGRVWLGGEDPAPATIAVRGGRILAVGSDTELEPLLEGAQVRDLGGRVVVPGLIDSHIHAVRAGVSWGRALHWEDVRSLDAALESIALEASRRPPGEWIAVLGGWHPRQLAEGRPPTRAELDRVAPGHPVYVQYLYDGAVLNSRALDACGWDDDSPDPVRGELERDGSGRLTGRAFGVGAFTVPLGLLHRFGLEEAVAGTRRMLQRFTELGLTGIADAGGLLMTPAEYRPLFELWRRESLPLRARLFLSAWTRGAERDDVAAIAALAPADFGDGMLRWAGIGEIPHLGCHDMEGFTPFELADEHVEELVEIVRECVSAGLRMSVHAVLDSTLSRILDAWERVEAETGGVAGRRFSIVHADEASPENLRRIAALGAGILVQNRLTLKASDYVELWGERKTRNAPPLGTMRELGIPVGAGTDATRANWYSPWASIHWLVTGESIDGAATRNEEHRLSLPDALHAYTSGAAWFTGEEHRRGRLLPGFDADLAVLDTDPFAIPHAELPGVASALTVVGGRIVHERL